MNMKKLIIVIHFFVFATSCQSYAQMNFESLVKKFSILHMPINEIEKLQSSDTLNIDAVNKIFVTAQSPPYYIQNGKKVEEKKYYGKIMRESANYTASETNKKVSFNTNVFPIGKVTFDENYISVIIKVVALETTFYDVYNFTKDGKLMSFVPLYLGYRDAPHKKDVSHVVIKSEITKDGLIKWHENMDGLETFRTYKLNEDGYFEIIKEEQKGEYEF